ncbi:MAG: hypothetical protein WKF73_22340 [Nocardioidaceae bacterium]
MSDTKADQLLDQVPPHRRCVHALVGGRGRQLDLGHAQGRKRPRERVDGDRPAGAHGNDQSGADRRSDDHQSVSGERQHRVGLLQVAAGDNLRHDALHGGKRNADTVPLSASRTRIIQISAVPVRSSAAPDPCVSADNMCDTCITSEREETVGYHAAHEQEDHQGDAASRQHRT